MFNYLSSSFKRAANAAPLCNRTASRVFGDGSGARRLQLVVQELQKQGKLVNASGKDRVPHFSPAPGPGGGPSGGFVDIDDALMADINFEDVDATMEEAVEEEDEQTAEDRTNAAKAAAALAAKEKAFAEVAQLSEEELRERVRKSIEELVPPQTAAAVSAKSTAASGDRLSEEQDQLPDGSDDSLTNARPRVNGFEDQDTSELTPAQIFYLENRERLVARAQDYYLEKHRELQQQREGGPADVEDEWRYYHDPVVRPPKGHLWSTGQETYGDPDNGQEDAWLQTISAWPRGQLPTAEMLADLLRSEQAQDVTIIDLEECGRRDVGTFVILGTGMTARHCMRLGQIVSKATTECAVAHVTSFCFGTRDDQWVVAHCGPIKVHIFTPDAREEYKLELLYRQPEEFFQPGDFPHYVEVYGTATEAFLLNGGNHITQALGSRSRSNIPAPYRDVIHGELMQPDYEAAEDAKFATPAGTIIDVTGETLPPRRKRWESTAPGDVDRSNRPWSLAGDEEESTDDEADLADMRSHDRMKSSSEAQNWWKQ